VLEDCSGLDALTLLGGNLLINYNESLAELTGINSLTTIGGDLYIINNNVMTSLTGLDNLTTINGDLYIGFMPPPPASDNFSPGRNSSLISLEGLNSLTSIDGNLIIHGNDALVSIEALDNLASIDGDLNITGNASLPSLTGLENIDAFTIDSIYISYNSSLTTCDALTLCNYLGSPNGSINIYGNAPGCNNASEVAEGCGIAFSCLPYGHYYFITQSEIDNFPTNFPDCSNLAGNILIRGGDITNLDGLSLLTSIGSDLTIIGNSVLNDLTGLESLTLIGGNLTIHSNDSLSSLTGLNSLSSIGGILAIGNPSGNGFYDGNPVLSNISALENIEAGSIEALQIVYNPSLAECAITSICEYLAGPGATVSIYENAPGCNSQVEVEAVCDVDVPEEVGSRQSAVSSFPNPFSNFTTLEYELEHITKVNLLIYNHLGQRVAVLVDGEQVAGRHQVRWNATALPAGIYFYRLTADDYRLTTGKLVSVK
jgi:hypothetical protein